jgi:ketosteroid isomerase-like protein
MTLTLNGGLHPWPAPGRRTAEQGPGRNTYALRALSATNRSGRGTEQRTQPDDDPAREGYAACGRGDRDAPRTQSFAGAVRWHVPGPSPPAGDHEAPGQVIQHFTRVFELTGGTFSIELPAVPASDEHAAAPSTIRGERAGRQLNDTTVLTYHIRHGKVTGGLGSCN